EDHADAVRLAAADGQAAGVRVQAYPGERAAGEQGHQTVPALVGDGDGVARQPPQGVRHDHGQGGAQGGDHHPQVGVGLGAGHLVPEGGERGRCGADRAFHVSVTAPSGRAESGSVARMCGRYAASRSPEDLAGIFEIEKWEAQESLEPDYNVAPTKEVHAVLDRPVKDADDPRPVRQLRTLKWGLVPSWSKTPEGGARMINARAETVHEKPSYRRAFSTRRCILPADGYYEWVTGKQERELEVEGKKKRPRKQP